MWNGFWIKILPHHSGIFFIYGIILWANYPQHYEAFSCLQYLWLGTLRIFLSYMKSYYNEFISPWWDISFPLLIGIYRKDIFPIFCYIWEFAFPSIKEVIFYPNISVDFYNLFFSQRWCYYYLFLPSMVVLLIPHHSGIFFFATSALTPTIEGIPRAGFIQ